MRFRLLLSCFSAVALAQGPSELMKDPAVKAAMDAAVKNEPQILELQARICEIPAPPFQESVRGREFQKLFAQMGLKDVRVDGAGNVIGVRPGKSPRPNVVFAAHLDTVFPEGTNVKTSRTGTIISGPGIGDNCRGLAVMIGVIRALNEARVETPGTLTFVANVGEEGLGDLRGVKHLFNDSLKGRIDKFVSIDGLGTAIANVGVGSIRYRVTFTGPGGHSFGAFGMANPIQTMGRAMAKIDAIQVPEKPKTTFNVGRVGGGTSVNSIPYEAWMEIDMRSSDTASLAAVHDKIKAAIQEAVAEGNARWGNRNPVSVNLQQVGLRPAGKTPETSSIVETAVAVSRTLGLPEALREGSTDSNVPMSLGVPAITINGGGVGSGGHSLQEKFDSKDSWRGTQRAVLLLIALAR